MGVGGEKWGKGEKNPQENVPSLEEAANATGRGTVCVPPYILCASENCFMASAAQQTSTQPAKPNSDAPYSGMYVRGPENCSSLCTPFPFFNLFLI